MSTEALFQRYYFSRPDYVSGTVRFHDLIQSSCVARSEILEIGCGPSNQTSNFLSRIGRVTGIDIEAVQNEHLFSFRCFDGSTFPFSAHSFDVCVSNYVLEHIADTERHFSEVWRVLRPGGMYLFRTPNLWHYVALGSRLLPHRVHLKIANRLRGISGRDPYPTHYLANSREALRFLCLNAGLLPLRLEMIEAEPSYGAAHPLLFYPMMAYERLVNRFEWASRFRANILGCIAKPN